MDLKDIKYQALKLQQLDEVTTMVIDAFQSLQTREQLQFRIRVSINLFLNSQDKFNQENATNIEFAKVLKHKQKIIAMVMAVELHIFFTDLLPMIDPQDPYIQIYKYLPHQQYKKGTALFGSMLVVHKDYMKYKLSNTLIENAVRDGVKYGFNYVFGTATNPISLKLALHYGATVLKEMKIVRNGKQGDMTLVRISLQDMLKSIKPKL